MYLNLDLFPLYIYNLVSDAYRWLGPPLFNMRFSLDLTICESCDLFFVSSYCVNLIRLFLCGDSLHKLGSTPAS